MTMVSRTFCLIIILAVMSSCSQSPPPAPTYAAPEPMQAKIALSNAMTRGFRSGPSAEETMPKEGLNGWNFYATAAAQSRESTNDMIESKISNLKEPTILNCEWQYVNTEQFDRRRAPPENRAPETAYLCTFVERYKASWGTSAGLGKGYFYRDGDTWVYDGEEVHGYKEEQKLLSELKNN